MIGKVRGRVEHGLVPETELIAAAQSGDVAAYEKLVLLHEQTALRAAFLVVRDPKLAEDVSQEAFIKAYRSLGTFRAGAPFRPWLMRIVINQARNLNRADRSRAATAQRYGDELRSHGQGPSPESAVVETERRDRLLDAVARLRRDDQTAIHMRYFLELETDEIAHILGCAEGTVRSRVHRASRRLRVIIEEDYPDLVAEVALGAEKGTSSGE